MGAITTNNLSTASSTVSSTTARSTISTTAQSIRSLSTFSASSLSAATTSASSSSVSTISASTTIGASSAVSTSSPTLVPSPDNSVSSSGIAIGVVFGIALVLSICLLLFYKLRSIKRLQKGEYDDESLISEAEKATPDRPSSFITSANGRDYGDSITGTNVHIPDSPSVRLPSSRHSDISEASTPSFTKISHLHPRPSMSTAEPSPQTPQFLPIPLERHQRHSLPSSRLSLSTFQPPPTTSRNPSAYTPPSPTQLNCPSAQDASVVRPSRLHIHLPHISSYRPRKSSPLGSTRPLSLNSSAAILMRNPAIQGHSLNEISPGLDPEYPYPMTPDQVGNGREVSVWARVGSGRLKRSSGEVYEGSD